MLLPVLFLVAAFTYYFGINRILGLPPGPPPLPFIGNMLSFRSDLDKVLLEWKSRYGRIFTVWLPFPIVVIGDHKVLQEHVVKNGDVFVAKKNPEQLMQMMSGGLLGLVFEDNSMIKAVFHLKEQRKFALKSLHEIGFGSAALEDTVHNYAMEVVSRWKNAGDGQIDVTENIMKVVGNTIWNVTFGIELDFDNAIVPKFRHYLEATMPLMAGPLMMMIEAFPFLKKFDYLFNNHCFKLQDLFDKSNEMAINATQRNFNQNNQPICYVEAFLREMKKNEYAGRPSGNFHMDQLRGSVMNLWGAGFDTTVAMTRMCCLELVNHPEVQTKLQKEVDDVCGERRIRYEDYKRLPYTCAFLQEARLQNYLILFYPVLQIYRLGNVLPINFLRLTTQNTEIEGWPLAAGTTVLPQFSMVHSDPNEFERPDYFCPERHIDNDGNFVKDPRITPFSIGRRACIGESLARMEVFVMLTSILQNCHLSPVGKVPPPVKFLNNFTRCVDDFMVNIKPRTSTISK